MSDTMKEYIAEAEKDLLHTYNRYQIVLDKGEGVHLYDTDGKKYLDFVAGIAVFALGYQNKAYNDALKAQIDKVIHTSNSVSYTPPIIITTCLPSRRLVRSKKYPAWIVSFSPIPVRKQWKVPLRLPENMRI